MNNQSYKPDDTAREDTAVTVMIGNEPEEVTFSVNNDFNSFDKPDKKIKQYEEKKAVHLWKRDWRAIEVVRKQTDRHLDKWIKYYELIYFCIHGGRKFQEKEKEREPLSKSWVVLVLSTIKYLNYGILRYCFLFVVEPLENVVSLHYPCGQQTIVKDYRWHISMKIIIMKSVKYVHRCKISLITKITNYLNWIVLPVATAKEAFWRGEVWGREIPCTKGKQNNGSRQITSNVR